MLAFARCAEESVPVGPDMKSEHSAEIDVLEAHGRNVLDHVRTDSFRLFALPFLVYAIHMVRVPAHCDVRQQSQSAGGGGQFLRSPTTLRYRTSEG